MGDNMADARVALCRDLSRDLTPYELVTILHLSLGNLSATLPSQISLHPVWSDGEQFDCPRHVATRRARALWDTSITFANQYKSDEKISKEIFY